MKALVFSRRRIHKNRLNSVKAFEIFDETVIYSDERWLSDDLDIKWWGVSFYKYFNAKGMETRRPEVDYDDIIPRCRVLRLININEAVKAVNSAFDAWEEILEMEKPDLVYSLPVDSYILDILFRLCKKHNILNLHLTYTPVSSYIRLTACGEMVGPIREVETPEIEGIYNKLIAVDYKPNWLFGDKSNKVWKVAFRRMAIDHLKIPVSLVYRYFGGDKFSFSAHPKKYLLQFGRISNFLAFQKLEKRPKGEFPENFIYIPLAFYPEASTDYWVPEMAMIDHHRNVLETIKQLPEETFVVKEHPVVYGRRPAWFYKEIFKLKNVYIADSSMNSGFIAQKARIVMSHHSSTAFQAILSGGKVIFFGKPYYGSAGFPVLRSLTKEAISTAVAEAEKVSLSKEDVFEFLRSFLSYCDKGELGNWAEVGDKSYIVEEKYIIADTLKQEMKKQLNINKVK